MKSFEKNVYLELNRQKEDEVKKFEDEVSLKVEELQRVLKKVENEENIWLYFQSVKVE